MPEDLPAASAQAGPLAPLVRFLVIALLLLDGLFTALHLLIYRWHLVKERVAWQMFDLGSECNLPTWYASILWFLAALAAVGCYAVRAGSPLQRRHDKLWLLIAAAFLVASADEVASVHEEVGSYLQGEASGLGLSSVVSAASPHSPWIIFYAPFLVAFAVFLVAFLWQRLAFSIWLRLLLVLAIECYALAVGLDYYQGLSPADQDVVAQLFALSTRRFVETSIVIEETLENIGTSLLVIVFSACVNQKLAEQKGNKGVV